MHLPEDLPEVVELFVQWMYRREIPDGNSESYVNHLNGLHMFAQKLCMSSSALQDMVMGKFRDVSRKFQLGVSQEIVKRVYSGTLKG